MFIRVLVVLCFAVMALAGFSGIQGLDVQEASAAAANAQEVVDAWDNRCAEFNFDECPADVLSGSCLSQVGSLYAGSNYAADCEGLMTAIQIEVDSSQAPVDPGVGDLVSAVVEDTIWQQ